MTEKEVLKAFDGEEIRKESIPDNAEPYSQILTENLELCGCKFQVDFLFDSKDEKLFAVLITTGYSKTFHEDQLLSEELFKRIETELIYKYGPPISRHQEKTPDETTDIAPIKGRPLLTSFKKGDIQIESKWIFPNTEIRLFYDKLYNTKYFSNFTPEELRKMNPNITMEEINVVGRIEKKEEREWEQAFKPSTHQLSIQYIDRTKIHNKL